MSTSAREEKRRRTRSLKLSVLLRRRRLRSRDSVNFRKEQLIDKLISMLLEPNVPLKKLNVSRELVKLEKLLTVLRLSRTLRFLDSDNSRIRNKDLLSRLPPLERNSWLLSQSRRLTKNKREDLLTRSNQL